MAVHVQFKSLYISLPSSAKQREMILPCLANVNQDGFSNLSLCPRFSFFMAVTVTSKVNVSRVPRDSFSLLRSNLVPRAHVPLGQHQDTELWNNQFPETKILGLPASRRMRGLV